MHQKGESYTSMYKVESPSNDYNQINYSQNNIKRRPMNQWQSYQNGSSQIYTTQSQIQPSHIYHNIYNENRNKSNYNIKDFLPYRKDQTIMNNNVNQSQYSQIHNFTEAIQQISKQYPLSQRDLGNILKILSQNLLQQQTKSLDFESFNIYNYEPFSEDGQKVIYDLESEEMISDQLSYQNQKVEINKLLKMVSKSHNKQQSIQSLTNLQNFALDKNSLISISGGDHKRKKLKHYIKNQTKKEKFDEPEIIFDQNYLQCDEKIFFQDDSLNHSFEKRSQKMITYAERRKNFSVDFRNNYKQIQNNASTKNTYKREYQQKLSLDLQVVEEFNPLQSHISEKQSEDEKNESVVPPNKR